jgi:UDP-glucuronate 4-epimerase
MERDFTYVDDIVEGVYRLISKPPEPNENWTGDDPDPATSFAPYQIFNIGNSNPVKLMDFIGEIENQLGIEAEKNMMDMQPGDVAKTWADVEDLFEYINFRPQIGIEEGISQFIDWYKKYYQV